MRGEATREVPLAPYGQRTLGRGAAAKQPTHALGGRGAAQKVAEPRRRGQGSGRSGERWQNGGPGLQVCRPGSPGAEADRPDCTPSPFSRRPQPRGAARTAGLVVWLEFCLLALPLPASPCVRGLGRAAREGGGAVCSQFLGSFLPSWATSRVSSNSG